jgi:phosphohistidine phosphatase SixA
MGESVRDMAPQMMTSAARPAACADVTGAGAEIMAVGHAPILAATGAALLGERHVHLVTSTRIQSLRCCRGGRNLYSRPSHQSVVL